MMDPVGPQAARPSLPPGWTVDACDEELRTRCNAPEPAPDLGDQGWRLRLVEDDLCLAALAHPRGFAMPGPYIGRTWSDACGRDAYAAYVASFRDRPGFPGWPCERWLAWATGYASFRPELSQVVSGDEGPVGFLVSAVEPEACWVVQMGVVPAHRRRGLGRALLEQVRHAAHEAGCSGLMLSVNVNNPEAKALYEVFGFCFHARRAVYQRGPAGGAFNGPRV